MKQRNVVHKLSESIRFLMREKEEEVEVNKPILMKEVDKFAKKKNKEALFLKE